MDELVLMDDDMMDLPPEDLPRRVLSDFAVYNSEGFCSSLELLPMWSGVDPDVDLYASGNVLDDDGEWAGGQALNTGKHPMVAVYTHIYIYIHQLTCLRTVLCLRLASSTRSPTLTCTCMLSGGADCKHQTMIRMQT